MYITYILTYMYFFFRFFFIIGYYKTLKWQPTPAFLPGKFHGRKSLAGYSPWGRKEWDTTERLHFLSIITRH